MIKTIKRILVSLSLFSLVALPLAVPATVAAADDVSPGLACGANLDVSSVTTGTPNCDVNAGGDPGTKLNDIVKLVINIFSLIVGVIAVIMIIVGGIMYATSAGDAGRVKTAKDTILYAVIGIVVAVLAYSIVNFVLTF